MTCFIRPSQNQPRYPGEREREALIEKICKIISEVGYLTSNASLAQWQSVCLVNRRPLVRSQHEACGTPTG
ncbi:unnamed protein product [Onchocerca flexuosa]|uniref:Transcriptional regulator n=1 Tax=Onchocerca flexuosa TaxID=387005 RepID=A0A183I582_9BILA|nr:unnamed protein product [Onchocerca flexuosa]